jgi:hypothetical protein
LPSEIVHFRRGHEKLANKGNKFGGNGGMALALAPAEGMAICADAIQKIAARFLIKRETRNVYVCKKVKPSFSTKITKY